MRMSDILRGGRKEPDEPEKRPIISKDQTPPTPPPSGEKPSPFKMRPEEVPEETPKVSAEELYDDFLKYVKEDLVVKAKGGHPIDGEALQRKIERQRVVPGADLRMTHQCVGDGVERQSLDHVV